MKRIVLSALKHAALIVFGLILGIVCLEIALRTTGWVFLQVRQAAPARTKQPNQYRVLCLGESTTADIAFLGEESYPAQLERILNQEARGLHFTVINGGLPATTTDHIVEHLQEDIDRYRPDIVVTMMGINDGESIDPIFRITGYLRVGKLMVMLYHRWKEQEAPSERTGPPIPNSVVVNAEAAWEHSIAGRLNEAEIFLRPLLDYRELPVVKSRAHAAMAALNWQRGNEREAQYYYQRFLELEHPIPKARTIRNYHELQRILRNNRISLVAVQYPALPLDLLKQLVDPDPDIVFVDNQQTFIQVIKERPLREVYRDLFAGIFGHMTPYANGLLAQNVARGVLEQVARHRQEREGVAAATTGVR